jgi:hypothetical protein
MQNHLQNLKFPVMAAVKVIETGNCVRTRAERGFSHNLCPNQPFDCHRPNSRSIKAILILSFILLIMTTTTGCRQLPSWIPGTTTSSSVDISILQVQPTNRPGVYSVVGSANFPDQTQLTVAAVRLLSDAQSSNHKHAKLSYELLDRQFTTIERGNWRASLNLWQVAPSGDFQEPWQISQPYLSREFQASPQVTFTATFDPVRYPNNFQRQIEEGDRPLVRPSLAQYNADGEVYLQASKTLAIALPTGRTTPLDASTSIVRTPDSSTTSPSPLPVSLSSDISESSSAQSRTDAPLTPQEFLR